MQLFASTTIRLTEEDLRKVNILKEKEIKIVEIFRAGLEKLLAEHGV